MGGIKRGGQNGQRKKTKREKKDLHQQGRKDYVKLQLIEYGHMKRLTEGASGSRSDGQTGKFR
jgi:hypothetical protein